MTLITIRIVIPIWTIPKDTNKALEKVTHHAFHTSKATHPRAATATNNDHPACFNKLICLITDNIMIFIIMSSLVDEPRDGKLESSPESFFICGVSNPNIIMKESFREKS